MAEITLAETIKKITKEHLENGNGILMGQCITAVGWVQGTVPDCKNICELPMTDVAGAGFAVGAAIAGRRPIFVLRFQDFFTLNCNPIVHYAALSKELHHQGVPVFVRLIGADAAGPVHSIVLHNIPMYFPGLRVYSPMTPKEYQKTWEDFMSDDTPMVVSEHRNAYKNTKEWEDIVCGDADIAIYAISDAREKAINAVKMLEEKGIKASLTHIMKLKPLETEKLLKPLKNARAGLVVDNGFPICGAARNIAYELMENSDKKVYALSCSDNTKCFNPAQQNLTPNAETIFEKAMEILRRK